MIYLKTGLIPLNLSYDDEIVQEANGLYQLTFKFPKSDELSAQLKEEAFLLADDLHGEQEFFVFEVKKSLDHVTVYANQVSTLLNSYAISSISVDRVPGQTVMTALAGAVVRACPFHFFSDVAGRHTLNLSHVSVMEALVKGKHSIVGQWGGDLVRDKYGVRLLANGGAENQSLFMYRKNLSQFEQERSIKDLRTRIHFRKIIKSEEAATKDQVLAVTVDSPLIGQYSQIYEATMTVEDQDVTDEASLRAYGQAYYGKTLCDLPEEGMELAVVGEPDTPVRLYDVVSVLYDDYGIDLRLKISKYRYAPMSKRLKSIGFGKVGQTLGGAIGKVVSNQVEEAKAELVDDFDHKLQKEIDNANAAFDAEFDKAKQAIEDGIEEAKAAGEVVKAEISSEVEAVAREAQAVRQAVETGLIEARVAGEALKAAVTAEVEVVAREGQAVKQAVEAGLAEAERAAQVLGSEVRNRVGQVEAKANQLADQARQADQKADQALTRAGASEHLALTAKDTADRAIRQAGDNLRTAQERANQLQTDLDAAKRSITSQARDILTQAQAQADLSRKVQTVEETANGTRSTVTELTKTVNVATGNLASVTQRVVTAENTLTGVRDQYRQLSQTVSGQTGQIAGINQKTATLERGLDRVGEQFEALEASNEGIRQELASYVRTATENTARLERNIQTTDGKAESAKTLAQQTADGLALKAEKSYVDDVKSTADSAKAIADGLRSTSATKAELKVVSDGITQLATKTEVNGVTGRLTTAEASIRTQADQIAQRLTSSQVESAITAKGYQTKAQVDANITGRGYITTAALAGYVPTTTFNNYKTETAQRIERGLTATRALIPTKGGVVNLVSNSTINQSSAAYGFATRQVKLEAGKTYWFGARAKKTGGTAGKEARVWLIAPGWAESRVLSFAGTDYETKFLKFSPKNTAIFDIRSYWFPNGGDRSGTADIDWYLVVESDLEPTGWVPNPEDMVSTVDFNRVKETAELYERVIGRSEGDIQTNVARQVLTSQLYQTEVKNPLTQLGSKVTQLEGSYGIQLSNKEKILSELNLNTGGVRIAGKLIHLDGTVTASDAFFRSVMADKIEAGNIKAGAVTTVKLAANAVTADKLVVDRALIDKLVTNSLWADRLFAQTAFITKLKAVDIQAGQIRAGLITTAMLAANAVTADKLVVDQALFTKLMANEAYLKQLFAKQAFITQVQAVDLSATRIKGGRIEAINGAMRIDLDQGGIDFLTDKPAIRRKVGQLPNQFIKFSTGTEANDSSFRKNSTQAVGSYLASITSIGTNRSNGESVKDGAFTGINIIASGSPSGNDVIDRIGLHSDITLISHSVTEGQKGWVFENHNEQNNNFVIRPMSPRNGTFKSFIGLGNYPVSNIYIEQLHLGRIDGGYHRLSALLKQLGEKAGFDWARTIA